MQVMLQDSKYRKENYGPKQFQALRTCWIVKKEYQISSGQPFLGIQSYYFIEQKAACSRQAWPKEKRSSYRWGQRADVFLKETVAFDCWPIIHSGCALPHRSFDWMYENTSRNWKGKVSSQSGLSSSSVLRKLQMDETECIKGLVELERSCDCQRKTDVIPTKHRRAFIPTTWQILLVWRQLTLKMTSRSPTTRLARWSTSLLRNFERI